MAKKSRATRNKHKDFQKVRLKAGVTKAGAKRQADATKRLPFVKTRRIDLKCDVSHVPQKFHTGPDFSSTAGQNDTLRTLISGLDQSNELMRKHCLSQLFKLIQAQKSSSTSGADASLPWETEKAEIIRKAARSLVDQSPAVSESASKLLCLLCVSGSSATMVPYCSAILSFIAVALTVRQHRQTKMVDHSLSLLVILMQSTFAPDHKTNHQWNDLSSSCRAITACTEQWITVLRSLLSLACCSLDTKGTLSARRQPKTLGLANVGLNACSKYCRDAVEAVRMLVCYVFNSEVSPVGNGTRAELGLLGAEAATGSKSTRGFTKLSILRNVIFEPLPRIHTYSLPVPGASDKHADMLSVTSTSRHSYHEEFLSLVMENFGVLTRLLTKQCRTTTNTHAIKSQPSTKLAVNSRRTANKNAKTNDDIDIEAIEYECLFKFCDMYESIITHIAGTQNSDADVSCVNRPTFMSASSLSRASIELLYRHTINFLSCISESDVLKYDAPVEKDPLLLDRLIRVCDLLEQCADSLLDKLRMPVESATAQTNNNNVAFLQKRDLLMTLLQTVRQQQGKTARTNLLSGDVSGSRSAAGEGSALNVYRVLLRQKPTEPGTQSAEVSASGFSHACGMKSLRFSEPNHYAEFDAAVQASLQGDKAI